MSFRNKLKIIAAFVVTFGASEGFAWPDERSLAVNLYHDTLAIKLANGGVAHGSVNIVVSATLTIEEHGNANFPDDRNCHFVNVRRVLTRSLNIVMPDGTSIPVRDTVIQLSADSGKDWNPVTPCNDVQDQAAGFLSSSIGSAAKWQSYIDGENANVLKIVSQFGQVS